MNLTFDQAIEEHRKMWNWIANETLKRKRVITKKDYLYRYPDLDLENECFLCEYVFNNMNCDCDYCPVTWRNSDDSGKYCCSTDALYLKFTIARDNNDHKEAAIIARKIAELPSRPEIKQLEENEEE